MSGADPGRSNGPSSEQLRYARVLGYGMKAGLLMLVVTFGAYVANVLPVQVPFEALPRLWALPVGDYLRESGMPSGWGWLALLDRGDVLALTGIAFLAGISAPCLVLLLPVYAQRRDWPYFAIALLLVCVLVLAASGILVSH